MPPRFACPILVALLRETSILQAGTVRTLRGGVRASLPDALPACHLRAPQGKEQGPTNIVWGYFRRRGFKYDDSGVQTLFCLGPLFSASAFWALERGPHHQAASLVSSRSAPSSSTTPYSRNRSRSRGDRPVIQRRLGHGCFPPARTTDWQQAKTEFFRDFYAVSNQPSVQSRLKFVHKALAVFGLVPLPPTVEKVHNLGVVLKVGRYSSAANYFAAYRTACERSGYGFDAQMARAVKDGVRSVLRGLGGPVRAAPLPFERLRFLDGRPQPRQEGGPMGSRNTLVLGAWFMLREIEAANVLVEHVQLIEDAGNGTPKVVLELPVSKTDQRALGAVRSHGCCCSDGFDPLCPAHAAWDQLLLLRRCFGHGKAGVLSGGLPFFPNLKGEKCTKEAMVKMIEHAAAQLKIPACSPDGSERISGHSMRVTGAQGMARLGLDLWAIQLLGRWGLTRCSGTCGWRIWMLRSVGPGGLLRVSPWRSS